MNTRSNTVGTAPPHLTRHARALPTAAGHRQCSDDARPRMRTVNPALAIRKSGDGTAAPGPLPLAGGPNERRQTTAAEPAINRDDPRRADLAQEDPLVQPDNARPRDTLHQRLSVGRAGRKGVDLPGTCNGHPTNMG